MYERQDPYRFGAGYLAATMATRDEAPPNSRPSQLYMARLERHLQLMGDPEKKVALLAGYNDSVIEILDQPLLWPTEHINPLSVLDPDRAYLYSPFRGTIDVADRLGYLDLHPTISYRKNGQAKTVPWPLQGDFLLLIKDGANYRCVNWPVKQTRDDFLAHKRGSKKTEEKSRRKKRVRYEIELVYNKDARIPTVPIAGDDIDDTLAANLLKLCCYASVATALEDDQKGAIIEALAAGIATGTPPSVILARFAVQERCTIYDARVLFHQAIWERKLRIDLFSPVRINSPAIPEITDVLDHYSDWFNPA